jgi:hypothetical protein
VHNVSLTPVTPCEQYSSDSSMPLTHSSRCFGAASAKERLDIVIRDAINAGDIPGPRYLANGKEMARPNGELVAGITAFADGPDEMREVIQHHAKLGVDNIKLSMSGEEVCEMKISMHDGNFNLTSSRSPRFVLPRIATLPTRKLLHASTRHTSTAKGCVHMPELETLLQCVSVPYFRTYFI